MLYCCCATLLAVSVLTLHAFDLYTVLLGQATELMQRLGLLHQHGVSLLCSAVLDFCFARLLGSSMLTLHAHDACTVMLDVYV